MRLRIPSYILFCEINEESPVSGMENGLCNVPPTMVLSLEVLLSIL